MKMLLVTFGLCAIILILFFLGVGIRILLLKNGEFKGTCSSQNPLVNKDGEDCPMCGRAPGEQCKADEMDSSGLPPVNA